MAINSRSGGDIKLYSLEHIANQSFDQDNQTSVVQPLGSDGVNLQRFNADNLAVKITVDGTSKYVGLAAPGTAQATAKWQCFKIDTSSGTVITYADSDANFDNVATDLTTLTYS